MPTPHAHQLAIADLIHRIKCHPMCADFHIRPDHYVVHYPAGFQLDGAQAVHTLSKTAALTRLLAAMERHWLESFPNPKTN